VNDLERLRRQRCNVLGAIYSTLYGSSGLAFAAYAWSHWGNWFTCWLWAFAMFLGWPVWLVYHFVVLRVMP
jgi:hypothetical protein